MLGLGDHHELPRRQLAGAGDEARNLAAAESQDLLGPVIQSADLLIDLGGVGASVGICHVITFLSVV